MMVERTLEEIPIRVDAEARQVRCVVTIQMKDHLVGASPLETVGLVVNLAPPEIPGKSEAQVWVTMSVYHKAGQ